MNLPSSQWAAANLPRRSLRALFDFSVSATDQSGDAPSVLFITPSVALCSVSQRAVKRAPSVILGDTLLDNVSISEFFATMRASDARRLDEFDLFYSSKDSCFVFNDADLLLLVMESAHLDRSVVAPFRSAVVVLLCVPVVSRAAIVVAMSPDSFARSGSDVEAQSRPF